MATTRVPVRNDTSADLGEIEADDGRAARYWYLLAISGLVSATIGVLVLAYPDPSLKLLGVFLGIDLLIAGTLLIVRGAASEPDPAYRPLVMLLGALALIAGLLVVRNPGETIVLLTLAFAIYMIVAGALAIGHAIATPGRRGATALRGAVLIAAGTVIISWPDISLKTLALLAGIALILQGVAEIAEGFIVRSAAAKA